jgi:hypothetical protein
MKSHPFIFDCLTDLSDFDLLISTDAPCRAIKLLLPLSRSLAAYAVILS